MAAKDLYHDAVVAVLKKDGSLHTIRCNFAVFRTGWLKGTRVQGAILHVDVKDGKIWVEDDGTDRPIADELVEAGVPKEDIVLAFYPENVRAHTGFAVR